MENGQRGRRAYDSGVDTQLHHLLTLLALYTCAVCKHGDSAALVAHQHIALPRGDDVELCDYDAQVANYRVFRAGVGERASNVVYVCQCI